MTYYTLQIHYGGTEKPKIEERKDLHIPEGKTFYAWEQEIRHGLFTRGFSVSTSPTAWEFISPFRIHTAYLIQQDKKHNP